VSPETLRFWTSTLIGGAGTFAAYVTGLVLNRVHRAAAADPKEIEALSPELREIPIVRKFVRQKDIRDARSA